MEQAATVVEEQQRIREDFELFDEPREKIEYIIDLGRDLPPLDNRHKTEANKVRGCQSQVWLISELDPATGRIRLGAESDAVIVKGLISLLLRLYSNRTAQEILDNPPDVFEHIGLGRMLTPGRSNGLYSMIGRIRQIAEAYLTADTVEAT